MTQAGTLISHCKDLATVPVATRAVELGEILAFWGPAGAGYSQSGPKRVKKIFSGYTRLPQDRARVQTCTQASSFFWPFGLPLQPCYVKCAWQKGKVSDYGPILAPPACRGWETAV